MKKILLNVALIASMAVSAVAQEMSIETNWGYLVNDGKANPVPELEGNWGGAASPQNAYCTRFGVGMNGKILVQNHKNNTISAITEKGVEVYKQLNAVTADKWNGTAISTDDAGNVIFNYCFTDAAKSVKYWGVINKNGDISDVNLTDANYSALAVTGRLDLIGKIVGDVTSAEGGIGYATTAAGKRVVMYHFKGDGTKVTSVTAAVSTDDIDDIAKSYGAGNSNGAAPKYLTVKEILAQPTPANQFIVSVGGQNPNTAPSVAVGKIYMYNGNTLVSLDGFGNRAYNNIATFILGGKQYIVRNYMDESSDLFNLKDANDAPVYSTWKNVMNYGVYDMEGKCVASWMGSGFASAYGMGNLNVEPVDDNTVRIYTYVATGSAYNTDGSGAVPECGTKTGIYCAVTTLKVKNVTPEPGELAGSGTEADPYLIGTAEDLCNAYKVMKANSLVYFKQTADIDMAGITEYHAINGSAGGYLIEGTETYAYSSAINYDGDNHIISNFQPKDRDAGDTNSNNSYYCSTIFGVLAGTVKNLGVVNAKQNIEYTNQGGGIFGAYFGHSQAATLAPVSKIENCFVQGEVKMSVARYAGGFVGTNATACEITNSYAQVDLESAATTGYVGMLVGRVAGMNQVKVTNSYAAGKYTLVDGTSSDLFGALFATTADTGITVDLNNVIYFGEGQWAGKGIMEDSKVKAEVYAAKDAAGIAKVQGWDAFNQKKLFNGYPALNTQTYLTVGAVFGDEVDENAPVEYYNLSGVRVSNPTPGIYIMKQGTKVTKVIVR